ncbi:hypothetical protein [Metallosphaera sp.]|uniref:hypothetical protein n=1 Tax=Metallosphaera sp. TaxID=2020860 RepID=UPI0031742512
MSSQPSKKQTVEVLSVSEVPAIEPNRLGQMDTLITYRVDPLHIFSFRVPQTNMTAQQIAAAVKADYAKRKGIVGMQVEV